MASFFQEPFLEWNILFFFFWLSYKTTGEFSQIQNFICVVKCFQDVFLYAIVFYLYCFLFIFLFPALSKESVCQLVLYLVVTTPPVIPVTELDLDLFVNQIVSQFKYIIHTFHHYYYLLLRIILFQVYCLEKANELHNHFVEGHPSSNKFTIDLASHVFHNLLGTMFTVSSMYKCKNYRKKCIVNNEQG